MGIENSFFGGSGTSLVYSRSLGGGEGGELNCGGDSGRGIDCGLVRYWGGDGGGSGTDLGGDGDGLGRDLGGDGDGLGQGSASANDS